MPMPDYVAAKIKAGHDMDYDPPHAITAYRRYTCGRCGDSVLYNGERVYGGAVERTCDEATEFWARGHLPS